MLLVAMHRSAPRSPELLTGSWKFGLGCALESLFVMQMRPELLKGGDRPATKGAGSCCRPAKMCTLRFRKPSIILFYFKMLLRTANIKHSEVLRFLF